MKPGITISRSTIALTPRCLESFGAVILTLLLCSLAPGSHFAWLLKFRWLGKDQHAIAFNVAFRLVPQHGAPLIPLLRKQVLSGESSPSAREAAELVDRIFKALPPSERTQLALENADFFYLCTSNVTRQLTIAAVRIIQVLFRYDPPNDSEATVRRIWPFRRQNNNVEFLITTLDTDGFLQNMLYLESGRPSERPAAALYFRDIRREPERIIPLLISNLAPTNSANLLQNASEALGSYGTNAVSALPMLSNLVTHPRTYVAAAASNAIQRINGP